MGEDVAMQFSSLTYRHQVPNPKWYNPFSKRNGAGITQIDLTLSKGQIVGLVGTNGAGKTTLLRMMSGILPLQEGKVSRQDKIVEIDELRSMVGFMPEQVRWSSQQTVRQTMTEFAVLQGCTLESSTELLGIVGLKNRIDSSLESLSQGMRQRLSLGIALLGTPSILVLDEPFNGMDPVATDAFKRLLRSLSNKGIAVVISSHHLSELDHIVDTIALLHKGQLVAHGTPESLRSSLGFKKMTEIVVDRQIDEVLLQSLNILEYVSTENDHRYVIESSHPKLLDDLLENEYEISTWRIVPPTLIELLCAATGMERETIGMEVEQNNMIPLRTIGGEEE